jgi:putative addiction module CopG family antidote
VRRFDIPLDGVYHERRRKTMPYQLPPELENGFAAYLASGRYSDMDAVMRQALSALESQDAQIAAIQQGIDEMELGLGQPLREFDREFRKAHGIPQDA